MWFPLHLLPKNQSISFYPHTDKLIHFVLFFFWSFFNIDLLRNLKLLLSIGLIVAVASEIGQIFIPFRSFDIFDLVFDILGLMPFLIYMSLRKLSLKN
jgi:VanZ family protein